MRHLANKNNEPAVINTQPTGSTRIGYMDLNNVMKPELLESDVSSVSEWDSESDSELDRAAQALDNLCNQQPQSTQVVTEPTVAKVTIPRIRAPSPAIINKIEMEAPTSSTTPTPMQHREQWLSDDTLHKLETVVIKGCCTLCGFQARELGRTKLHSRHHYTLHVSVPNDKPIKIHYLSPPEVRALCRTIQTNI